MTRATIDRIVDWLAQTDIPKVDLTGGAPEIIPDFRYLVERIKALPPTVAAVCDRRDPLPDAGSAHRAPLQRHIMDRCNLTIFYEAGHEYLPEFLTQHETEVIASLPLHLVYNPIGASLPGPQAKLEADYHRELKEHFGIVFNRLYTIINMPIARFAAWLRRAGKFDEYL